MGRTGAGSLPGVGIGTAAFDPLTPFVVGNKGEGEDEEGGDGEDELHKTGTEEQGQGTEEQGQGQGTEDRNIQRQRACFTGEDSLRRVWSTSRTARMRAAMSMAVSM
jgi:hypothetical protein